MPTSIRHALDEDVLEIVKLGKRMHEESSLGYLPFSEEKVKHAINRVIHSPKSNAMFVAIRDGTMGGFAAIYLIDYFFSDAYLAADHAFYVAPEFRGSSMAVRLFRAMEEWARRRCASELYLSVSTGIRVQSSHTFFSKLNMRHDGGIYKLSLR